MQWGCCVGPQLTTSCHPCCPPLCLPSAALQLIDERLQQVLERESQRHVQLQPSGNVISHVQRGTTLVGTICNSACLAGFHARIHGNWPEVKGFQVLP